MQYKLDKYQEKAVTANDKNTIVISAPGSGKTTVIINRVLYLVNTLGVNPKNIVVITFTKSAATNMKKRYLNLAKEKEEAPFFGTFHGLCYKILLRQLGEIKLIETGATYKIVTSVLREYMDDVSEDKIKEVINNISTYKTSIDKNTFKPNISENIFNEIYEKYEEYKKRNSLLDFDDLQIKLIEILESDNYLLNGYRRLFKYILVDEFQDCDLLQLKLLKLLNDKNQIYAVGDEDQCIYSFRGAHPECMVNFDKDFNGKKLYLSINYRSMKNIVEASKKLIINNKQRNDKEIKAFKDEDGRILYNRPFNENEQAELIADYILRSSKMESLEDNAIIYRTNEESRSIIDCFIRRGIPFRFLDKQYNFFEHFICKDLIAYLRLSIFNDDKEAFIRIINKPFRYISKDAIEYVRKNKEKSDVFEILKSYPKLHPFIISKIDKLKKEINYLNKLSLTSAIDYIITDLEYGVYLKEYAEKIKNNYEEFENVYMEFKNAATDYKGIIAFLSHIEEVNEEIKSNKADGKDRVILSTIHGVKGMEFNNVFIINVVEGVIPHENSIENNIEEERRLFYVGVTRAINSLYVFAPRNIRGRFKEPSSFIFESKLSIVNNKSDYGFKEGDRIHHEFYGEGVIESLKDDQVDIKFKEKINRKFSLKVLVDSNIIKKL